MSQHQDFLVEIQTEELPPKSLKKISEAFRDNIQKNLDQAQLTYSNIHAYATPRRLAVIVSELLSAQADQTIERKGPSVKAAYDKEGKPTPACLGFAKSCGIELENISTTKTDKGEWLYFKGTKPGEQTIQLLPEIVQQALTKLPIPKPMRWGNHSQSFIRPVHHVMMLFGKDIVEAEIFGLNAGRVTVGHRFLSPDAITLKNASDYHNTLHKKGHVMVDFDEREKFIVENISNVVHKQLDNTAEAVIDSSLLNEVTALVEWPTILIGQFDENFLKVPQEALISAMQGHQKCFPVKNSENKLLNYFVITSNIQSKKPEEVIQGNERVMAARLADAEFFYNTDCETTLAEHIDRLKTITYQEKLGSIYDKTIRIKNLAAIIASHIHANESYTTRAAQLCKADLVTNMVGEFPELQGTMGYYYAKNDSEPEVVAQAIVEHYQPSFAGDMVPSTLEGTAVALADKLDSLVGLFGIGQIPTGEKDPFGLRRAALGVIRLIVEKKLHFDITKLIAFTVEQFNSLTEESFEQRLTQFIDDRFKSYVLDNNITADVFNSVSQLNITEPYEAYCRMHAVQHFKTLPEAAALASANKRVNNILGKQKGDFNGNTINETLFETDIEKNLATLITEHQATTTSSINEGDYQQALEKLATLQQPIDQFFEEVMVMAENEEVKTNRLTLLSQLRQLFLQVADIAVLQ